MAEAPGIISGPKHPSPQQRFKLLYGKSLLVENSDLFSGRMVDIIPLAMSGSGILRGRPGQVL